MEKKFLGIGAILCGVGIIISIAGVLTGAPSKLIELGKNQIRECGDYVWDETADFCDNMEAFAESLSGGRGIWNMGPISRQCLVGNKSTDFESLKISIACGDVKIAESDNDYISIEGWIRDGKLDDSGKTVNINCKQCDGTVYIPKKVKFDSIDIDIPAGSLEIDTDIKAKEMKLNVGLGEFTTNAIDSESIILDLGAGDVEMEDISCKKAVIHAGIGSISIEFDKCSDVEINANGDTTIELPEKENAYNYNLSAAVGEVELNEHSLEGIGNVHSLDNGADKNITVDTALGSIEIKTR